MDDRDGRGKIWLGIAVITHISSMQTTSETHPRAAHNPTSPAVYQFRPVSHHSAPSSRAPAPFSPRPRTSTSAISSYATGLENGDFKGTRRARSHIDGSRSHPQPLHPHHRPCPRFYQPRTSRTIEMVSRVNAPTNLTMSMTCHIRASCSRPTPSSHTTSTGNKALPCSATGCFDE